MFDTLLLCLLIPFTLVLGVILVPVFVIVFALAISVLAAIAVGVLDLLDAMVDWLRRSLGR